MSHLQREITELLLSRHIPLVGERRWDAFCRKSEVDQKEEVGAGV